MAIMWSGSLVPWIDPNGAPYSGAKAYFFDAGTTTPRTVYRDGGLGVVHDHPVTANAAGMFPAIFLPQGDYRLRIETSAGATVWDVDNIATPPASDDGGGGGGDTDPTLLNQTGMLTDRFGTGSMAGWVRAAGRSIGNASSGATERANADCAALFSYLWEQDSTLAVSGGRGANAASDFASNKRIDLPDLRLRARIGLADMGNTTSTLIANAQIDGGETTTTLGATTGVGTVTLTVDQMPSHNHGGTVGANGSHNHDYVGQFANVASAAGPQTVKAADETVKQTSTQPDHQHTISSQGGGAAHTNVQPSALVTVYIKL